MHVKRRRPPDRLTSTPTGLVGRLVALPVGVLLGVLQTQLVAHLKGLTHRPHDANGLRLYSTENRTD